MTNTLVLLKAPRTKKKGAKLVSIIDLNEHNTIYSTQVTNEELIGRMRTDVYLFIDGHIYYNNQCIKIRYDLINQEKSTREYNESEIFDYYQEILQLQQGERVMLKFPIMTPETHRQIYVIQNRRNFS